MNLGQRVSTAKGQSRERINQTRQASGPPSRNNIKKQSVSQVDLRQSHFILGNSSGDYTSTNQHNQNKFNIAPNSVNNNRQELKERMSKTQFSFGMKKENTGMRKA